MNSHSISYQELCWTTRYGLCLLSMCVFLFLWLYLLSLTEVLFTASHSICLRVNGDEWRFIPHNYFICYVPNCKMTILLLGLLSSLQQHYIIRVGGVTTDASFESDAFTLFYTLEMVL